jgi:hypothetical protein
MASEDTFKLLPKELTELILSELEPVDLANSSGVSHHWRKLASNNLLWRKFFNDYHNITEPLKTVYGVSKHRNRFFEICFGNKIITDNSSHKY